MYIHCSYGFNKDIILYLQYHPRCSFLSHCFAYYSHVICVQFYLSIKILGLANEKKPVICLSESDLFELIRSPIGCLHSFFLFLFYFLRNNITLIFIVVCIHYIFFTCSSGEGDLGQFCNLLTCEQLFKKHRYANISVIWWYRVPRVYT